MDPVAARILSHLKEQRISKSSFSERSGINKASLSHLESGRNKASLALVEAFHKVFPEVDLHWILTGEHSHTPRAKGSIQPSPTDENGPQLKIGSAEKVSTPSTEQNSAAAVGEREITVLYADGTYRSFRPRDA